jgi:ATP-dependent RNA/DNA helicase IGHMBP2
LTPSQQSISKLIQLIKIEKEEDYAQYERKMLNTSIEERRKRGVTWYPVVLANRFISTGERYFWGHQFLEKRKNEGRLEYK